MNDPKTPRLYDKDFVYVPAAQTNVRDLFNRIRAQMQKQQRMQPVKQTNKGSQK